MIDDHVFLCRVFFVNFYVFVISFNVKLQLLRILFENFYKITEMLCLRWLVKTHSCLQNFSTSLTYRLLLTMTSELAEMLAHTGTHIFLFHISPDKCSNSFFFPVKLSIKIWLYEGCIYWFFVNVIVGNRFWWTVHYRGRGTRNLRKRWWWVVQGDKLLLSQ